jgi:hypothetical protein
MKIPTLFVQLYLLKGSGQHCYVEDLRWAWQVFVEETGVQPPESWLCDLILEHGAIIEEPAKGKTWRGWQVRGLALNPKTAERFNLYRLEKLGLCGKTEGPTE